MPMTMMSEDRKAVCEMGSLSLQAQLSGVLHGMGRNPVPAQSLERDTEGLCLLTRAAQTEGHTEAARCGQPLVPTSSFSPEEPAEPHGQMQFSLLVSGHHILPHLGFGDAPSPSQ